MRKKEHYVIVGLGITGLSCARFLYTEGYSFFVVDSKKNSDSANKLKSISPNIKLISGGFTTNDLIQADSMIVSPGVSLEHPEIKKAFKLGVKITSDIDLFCSKIKTPIIAITGSNGKSTVTTILGEMANFAGMTAVVAGNIGIPVLDTLYMDKKPSLYILELSSFQLERSLKLRPFISIFLNLSEDHLDIHNTLENYKKAKQCIYNNCNYAVFNKEDKNTWPKTIPQTRQIMFTLKEPLKNEYGIINHLEKASLIKNNRILLSENELKVKGNHNLLNIAAAMSAGEVLGFSTESMVIAAKRYSGLPHRCQWIANKKGSDWYNDSKGTNEAATTTAIKNISLHGKKELILIAGGDGKGSDFQQLALSINKYASRIILLGKDAKKIQKMLPAQIPSVIVQTMQEAVIYAASIVKKGNVVLLSPCCTSWDMFSNFEERGLSFIKAVKELKS